MGRDPKGDNVPRMAMGLGVVTDDTVRFYPMDRIEATGALIDEVDGRRLLVYVDAKTFTPAAMFVDAATATVEERDVRLDDGSIVRMGLLHDAAGARVTADRPQPALQPLVRVRTDLSRGRGVLEVALDLAQNTEEVRHVRSCWCISRRLAGGAPGANCCTPLG